MNVEIRAHGAALTEDIRSYVQRRLHFALGRFALRVGRVTVRLSDLNGPRGGVDQTCRITVERLPSRQIVVQECVDADLYAAIDDATTRIGRSFARALQRERERRTVRESIRTL